MDEAPRESNKNMAEIPFKKIAVVVPSLSDHDAISNDAFQQQQLLSSLHIDAVLYAESYRPHLKSRLIDYQELLHYIEDPEALLIYHHGVLWLQGEEILKQAKCAIHLKYHNITPPDFFRPYDYPSTFATEKGREQTRHILEMEKVDLYVGASHFNIEDLHSYGIPIKTAVVAPLTQIYDFDAVASDPATAATLRASGRKNVLFVGRVVPNKGHAHLLRAVSRFIDFYGATICLHIVGGFALTEETYFIELENLINQNRLGPYVRFHEKINSAQLKAFYEYSDVFLLMSEHEGFCVPILESQYLGLPIIALDRAAIGETLGQGQLLYPEVDYDFFASAIQHLIMNPKVRAQLIENGRKNYARFTPAEIRRQTLELLTQPI